LLSDISQVGRARELEQIIANCSVCRGLGVTKPDICDPVDLRFGKFVPCPACGGVVRERRELHLIELLWEPISRYTALVGTCERAPSRTLTRSRTAS
jgi:hypothetical protein